MMSELEILLREEEEVVSTQLTLRDWVRGASVRRGELRVVLAEYQIRGRGQRSNVWESERGRNVLMSLHCRPVFLSSKNQFLLSEAFALAVKDGLSGLVDVHIKWPNDIYVGDEKLGGILIECDWSGAMLGDAYIGLGLNVNQRVFRGDAPNAVSLVQLLGGEESNRRRLVENILEAFGWRWQQLQCAAEELQHDYEQSLYRRGAMYGFRLPTGEEVRGEIVGVEPWGQMNLLRENGEVEGYMFKEISYII